MTTAPVSHGHAPRVGAVHASLVLLSFAAGAADAFAFLALGGIFTANMTGNLILAGMFTRPEFAATLVAAAVAIVAFAGVLYVGFRATAGQAAAPLVDGWVARRLVFPSLLLQTVLVVVWLVLPGSTGMVERCVVIALSAASLALQTVAAKKLTDVDGITTTYVTGTLTTTMQAFAERRGSGQLVRLLSVLALPVGAVCGTAVLAAANWAGPILPWLALALALVVLFAAKLRATRNPA